MRTTTASAARRTPGRPPPTISRRSRPLRSPRRCPRPPQPRRRPHPRQPRPPSRLDRSWSLPPSPARQFSPSKGSGENPHGRRTKGSAGSGRRSLARPANLSLDDLSSRRPAVRVSPRLRFVAQGDTTFHDRWPDGVFRFWPSHSIQRLLCLVSGHVPIADQCNNPEHDYCAWCQKSMPNGAPEHQRPA